MDSHENRKEPHLDTHHIVLKERKNATLTGVKEVLSFDSDEVQLDTVRGHLAIKGKDLHVRRLTLERGEVDIDGTFDELKYSDSHTIDDTKSFLGRLFQ
ncbi:MAG: sporulation protein YabP [Eubacterium sp.]